MTRTPDAPTPSVLVVGGGFTGCLTALRLASAGVEVHLVEAHHQLGGVLRDERAVGRHWQRGCQYADPNAPWRHLLDEQVLAQLEEVPHSMGSLTVDHGDTLAATDLAVPMLHGALPTGNRDRVEQEMVPAHTLASRFAEYGAWAPRLEALAARSGFAPRMLSDRAAFGLQMSRVASADVSPEAVLAVRSDSVWADAHLAVSRAARGLPMAGALVPRAGWSAFFDVLHRQLVSRGVSVSLGRAVRVSAPDGRLLVTAPDDVPPCEVVVWAANPVPLYSTWARAPHPHSVPRLDNLSMQAVHVHADVTQWQGPVPHYVQWFAPDSPLLRVYVYRHGDSLQACLECVGPLDAALVARVARDAAVGCTTMGYGPSAGGLRFTPHAAVALRLHHLQSAADVMRLAHFEAQCSTPHRSGTTAGQHGSDAVSRGQRIVPGGWLSYAREDKLRDIARGLRLHGLASL